MVAGELRVVQGPASGQTIELRTPIVIGRDTSADVVLADDEMSRQHARVVVAVNEVRIEDLGSLNGTFVNGERIAEPRRLQSGDRIQVGTTLMEFVAAQAAEVTRARDIPAPDVTRTRDIPAPDVTSPRPIPAARAAAGELRIVQGATDATALTVSASRLLGRDPECDLHFEDGEISWRHARVAAADGGATIEDLGSTNGTFVNGERILERRRLESGNRIELGGAVLEYLAADAAITGVRHVPVPLTHVSQVLAQPGKLLTADTSSRKWWTLAAVGVGVSMLLIDTTIVAVALPSISTSLKASFSELQWVIDAYSVMLAALLLTAGSLSDIMGRRQVFLAGVVLFTAASALCGLAGSATALDIFRGVQGIGGAMMLGPSSALIAQEFTGPERGVAFGVMGMVGGLGVAIGPLIGGALTDGFGWESIFYVNLPIGAVVIALTLAKLVNLPGPKTRLDFPGLLTFTAGVLSLVFGLIRGSEEGWSSALIVSCLSASVVLLVTFFLIELRSEKPMMDLSLFRVPTFNGCSLASFCMSASVLALIIYITLWLQSVLDYSPLDAGLRLLAITGFTLVFAPIGGRLSALFPSRAMLGIGLGLMSVGCFFMSAIAADSRWTVLLPGLALCGTGLGLCAPTLSSTAVSIVPPWREGMASGLNYTWRQLGLATGIAGLGAVFRDKVSSEVDSFLAGSPLSSGAGDAANAISAGGAQGLLDAVPSFARAPLERAAEISFASGLHELFIISGVLAAIGAIAGFAFVRERDLISSGHGGGPGRGAPSPPVPEVAAVGPPGGDGAR